MDTIHFTNIQFFMGQKLHLVQVAQQEIWENTFANCLPEIQI